ncbi:carboxypeptidase-like regulatory domain-containing protein [Mucilaginibacter flavidus]|uniref:carboxypeptidase-like regulatory domain-containing protein n=1 Tax=Mucilaginibacter flavidus TaxID=2949309 RepID=UPI002092D362|nr:carboxypeptidase-like regulatory domain-containing protein [Mucilaginibacter flavidus]MCO5950948.1 carboxypeptidase-like regulatory domain-containing protein [Mucilaginibacter flavidus]
MKILIFGLFIAGIFSNALSQTISVSGTVKDAQGQVIPLAFVRDVQHYYATYADSAGSFLLKADPSSVLVAIANGFADTQVKIENKTVVNIVMPAGTSSSANAAGNSAGLAGPETGGGGGVPYYQTLMTQTGSSTAVAAGFAHEPTRGSQFLLLHWVHGFAIGIKDSLWFDINNLYNYDKASGSLLFTKDMKTVMRINKPGIKYFCLFNGKLLPLIFENASAISKKPYIEVLLNNSKYKIYKQTDNKLVKADFKSDGIITSGNRYDEYVDYEHYYFVKAGDKPKGISLKKKTLKELLGGDADKFIAAQGDRDVDDDYVRELGYSLAQ